MSQANRSAIKTPINDRLSAVLKIQEVLFEEKSPLQDILIAQTAQLGRVLLLNGELQLSDLDENFYHEMITHVPLTSLKNPRRALIIGGGDGGTLRELRKYSSLEEIYMVEIDGLVVDACNRFMPKINQSGKVYDDPRVRLKIQDGVRFIKEWQEWDPSQGLFDVILLDSSGFRGPAEGLFNDDFIASCAQVLNPSGILVTQSGAPSLEPDQLAGTASALRKRFKHVGCYLVAIPSYMCGYFSFSWASQETILNRVHPEIVQSNIEANRIRCGVYNVEFHYASFALPTWFRSLLQGKEGL